ncbi:LOW QUALITY PROTEIN: hypothetical protein U9M48_040523 [Paspalum notatum var. saurae]|uniref:Tf2-1-like SH3-like domain-containing protein n=1 Tax=Paspalum notatum var. saurae TaxID=547442 RepID=A0AAQ3UQT7_PASNO
MMFFSRFGTKGKLSPRYIGPFTILARIGKLAYRLELPESMKGVHNVFHVSMLRKYLRDPEHHITLESVTIEQDLTFEARLVRILDESERVLRHRTLKYVLWTNQTEREATWELESRMRLKYPELFTSAAATCAPHLRGISCGSLALCRRRKPPVKGEAAGWCWQPIRVPVSKCWSHLLGFAGRFCGST